MKKSFMTRVLAVTLSTAMAFSVSSAGNLMTASAATKPFVSLKTKFKTLTVGQKYKMTLKNNSIKWRIQKATSSDKTIVKPYLVKPTYVKLKGLKEGRVKVTYKLKTTKRKTNNTKTLKGTVKVKAKGGDTEEPGATFSATATAADTTSVKITFSQAIDTEGVTAENFTINNDVTVREAKVSEDGKTVDLTIAGATYDTEYEVTVKGVKVAGEAKDTTCKFKTPAAAAGYQPKLDVGDKPMKSDGQSTRVVKFELRDSAGELVEAEGVEVLFETTLGSFAEPRAVLDKGVAENTFTSQALNSTRTATITASVIAANNKDLIGQSVIGNIVLTPNPEQLTDTSIGAIITNVVAPTADRVVAYFQKDVEAKDFRKANGALDESKFKALVTSGVDSANNGGKQHKVIGILDVEGEPNALELLVEDPMTDNTTIKVEFQDKRNTSSVITSSNTVYCKLTDGYQPSALKVTVKDNRTLEVEFSEAVLRGQDVPQGNTNSVYAADRTQNYAIDAKELDFYGIEQTPVTEEDIAESGTVHKISKKVVDRNTNNNKGSVKVGTYSNAVDRRHIVTIQLGENTSLSAGRHSLSISNVGDWAAMTDGWRNIVNTATVDFVVPDNNEAPKFDLEVMSPEQFKLTANCSIGIVNSDETFRVEDSASDEKDIVILEQLRNGQWTAISNNAFSGDGCGYNPIMVSQIRDLKEGVLTNQYLVETRVDWTKVHDTKRTYNNYYNNSYRLRIPAGKIRNLANSKQNEEIIINLSDDPIMKSMDGTSPTMKSIEQVQDANGNLTENYQVTFSEPVKMSQQANKETLTPTQDVTSESLYSAYFVKRDASQKTIQAKVNHESFIDAVDTMIQVEPVTKLDAGDWDLYVRGVSDDVGNTVSTLSGTIHVEAQTVSTNFKVVWAAVSTTGNYKDITADEGHYILVKFNKPISAYGGSANVTSTLNYQVNGNPLPAGSSIRAHIQGYDSHNQNVVDSITIILPSSTNTSLGSSTMNYPVNGRNCILTISSAITSAEGDTLSTEPGYNMPYQFGEANVLANDKSDFKLSQQGDAVWGNHESEKLGAFKSSANPTEAYIKAFKAALADDKYRKVKLDEALTGELDLDDLEINRIVDIDLNGCSVKGNITIKTTTAADVVKIMNSDSSKTAAITGKSTADNSVTLTINTPNSSVELGENINIKKGTGKDAVAVKVNGVTPDTLTTYATVDGKILLSANSIGFRNHGNLSDAPIVVDSTGTINFKGDYKDTDVTLTKKATVNLSEISTNGITIRANAKDSTIVVPEGVKATIVAGADDIVVKYANTEDVILQTNGGTFKHKNIQGDDRAEGDRKTPTSAAEEEWVSKLNVIDGADIGNGSLTEVITVGAISGGAFFTSGENENIETGLKETTASDANYEITNVNLSVNASYLSYDANNKKVGITESAKNLTSNVTNEFTVKITVRNRKTKDTTIITKKIRVTINKKEA